MIVSFLNNLMFSIKASIDKVTLLYLHEENWGAFNAVKKFIAYYDNNWLLHKIKNI